MSKSLLLKEFEKLADSTIIESENRNELFNKLAFSNLDRKGLNKELATAQKAHSKAKEEFSNASSQLAALNARVERAKAELEASTNKIVQLNELSKNFDLSGAQGVSLVGDEVAYIINGRRVHVDSSDINDIKINPWREYISSKKGPESFDTNEAAIDDMAPEYQAKSFEDFLASDDSLKEMVADEDESFEDENLGDGDNIFNFNFNTEASVESRIITKIAKKYR